ncbi:MAG: PIN domain-containing protein [Prevotellaceae bacterium]|jgi:predicted nucleic acid-binding protein|nr:PIN domain-containing protein [Prevotellaceae bacterium]
MSGSIFLDTNIFVYLYSEDELEKQAIVANLLEHTRCVISTQVLNEFCSVCLRKLGMLGSEVQQSINEIVGCCELAHIDMETIQKALALSSQYGYSYYDCLILASALEAGSSILYSEDMQHNQLIEGRLKIINPFL